MNVLLLNRQKRQIATKTIKALLKTALEDLGHRDSEVSLLMTDDAEIRELNRLYLDRDRPTDVLSFPTDDNTFIGDIAISLDRAAEQAEEQWDTLTDELARLLIHGLLHLLGHEHEEGGREAEVMFAEERRLMALINDKGLL
ncbi:MAG: rRNA maturation RNase YbeY [Thermodesulfobacteriota bacterium]